MIALFKPVRNAYGFDIRELYKNKKGRICVKKYLPIEKWIETDDMPVFRPQTVLDKKAYQDQFLGWF